MLFLVHETATSTLLYCRTRHVISAFYHLHYPPTPPASQCFSNIAFHITVLEVRYPPLIE